jgi:hypothetical protein
VNKTFFIIESSRVWRALSASALPDCILLIGGIDQTEDAEQGDRHADEHHYEASPGAIHHAYASGGDEESKERDSDSNKSHLRTSRKKERARNTPWHVQAGGQDSRAAHDSIFRGMSGGFASYLSGFGDFSSDKNVVSSWAGDIAVAGARDGTASLGDSDTGHLPTYTGTAWHVFYERVRLSILYYKNVETRGSCDFGSAGLAL